VAADAVLLADKPAGLTSHDLVARARRALGTRRVGHAGTLDPFATGLLILLAGRATRTQRYFMALPKTYEVIARLGARSSTGDPEGEIEVTGRVPPQLAIPVGEVHQRPPAYSAVKVGGERAYARARRGEDVELPQRTVHVHEAALLWHEDDRAAFRIVCSSGTYIRSLIADLGDAYCLELRRTHIGPFAAQGAWPGEGAPHPVALGVALTDVMPVVTVDGTTARAAEHGQLLELDLDGPVLLQDDGGPVAIAERRERGVRAVVGFRP
jgi:tRNA pseudouridine55 synthase